jgi:phosphonate transport system permease protein
MTPLAASPRLERFLLRPPYGWRSVAIVLVLLLFGAWSAQRVEIDRMVGSLAEWASASLGLSQESQVGRGLSRALGTMWPPVVSERVELARLPDADRNRLPPFASIELERRVETRIDPATLELRPFIVETEVLVLPFGYLLAVLLKMWETVEIAIWATAFAIVLSLPLAVLASANYTPHRAAYVGTRGLVSGLRAVPELISALFLVLAFGFGPVAGVLALALHAAGFLGEFFAEDIENADRKPQEALSAIGARPLAVLWVAVLPQVLPQYVAYGLYILDRNVRMAAVIGLVGAGGIGQELKGRWDMFQYGHVATILLVIFVTVFLLDQVAAALRTRLIEGDRAQGMPPPRTT